jgi:hypothetical protein
MNTFQTFKVKIFSVNALETVFWLITEHNENLLCMRNCEFKELVQRLDAKIKE